MPGKSTLIWLASKFERPFQAVARYVLNSILGGYLEELKDKQIQVVNEKGRKSLVVKKLIFKADVMNELLKDTPFKLKRGSLDSLRIENYETLFNTSNKSKCNLIFKGWNLHVLYHSKNMKPAHEITSEVVAAVHHIVRTKQHQQQHQREEEIKKNSNVAGYINNFFDKIQISIEDLRLLINFDEHHCIQINIPKLKYSDKSNQRETKEVYHIEVPTVSLALSEYVYTRTILYAHNINLSASLEDNSTTRVTIYTGNITCVLNRPALHSLKSIINTAVRTTAHNKEVFLKENPQPEPLDDYLLSLNSINPMTKTKPVESIMLDSFQDESSIHLNCIFKRFQALLLYGEEAIDWQNLMDKRPLNQKTNGLYVDVSLHIESPNKKKFSFSMHNFSVQEIISGMYRPVVTPLHGPKEKGLPFVFEIDSSRFQLLYSIVIGNFDVQFDIGMLNRVMDMLNSKDEVAEELRDAESEENGNKNGNEKGNPNGDGNSDGKVSENPEQDNTDSQADQSDPSQYAYAKTIIRAQMKDFGLTTKYPKLIDGKPSTSDYEDHQLKLKFSNFSFEHVKDPIEEITTLEGSLSRFLVALLTKKEQINVIELQKAKIQGCIRAKPEDEPVKSKMPQLNVYKKCEDIAKAIQMAKLTEKQEYYQRKSPLALKCVADSIHVNLDKGQFLKLEELINGLVSAFEMNSSKSPPSSHPSHSSSPSPPPSSSLSSSSPSTSSPVRRPVIPLPSIPAISLSLKANHIQVNLNRLTLDNKTHHSYAINLRSIEAGLHLFKNSTQMRADIQTLGCKHLSFKDLSHPIPLIENFPQIVKSYKVFKSPFLVDLSYGSIFDMNKMILHGNILVNGLNFHYHPAPMSQFFALLISDCFTKPDAPKPDYTDINLNVGINAAVVDLQSNTNKRLVGLVDDLVLGIGLKDPPGLLNDLMANLDLHAYLKDCKVLLHNDYSNSILTSDSKVNFYFSKNLKAMGFASMLQLDQLHVYLRSLGETLKGDRKVPRTSITLDDSLWNVKLAPDSLHCLQGVINEISMSMASPKKDSNSTAAEQSVPDDEVISTQLLNFTTDTDYFSPSKKSEKRKIQREMVVSEKHDAWNQVRFVRDYFKIPRAKKKGKSNGRAQVPKFLTVPQLELVLMVSIRLELCKNLVWPDEIDTVTTQEEEAGRLVVNLRELFIQLDAFEQNQYHLRFSAKDFSVLDHLDGSSGYVISNFAKHRIVLRGTVNSRFEDGANRVNVNVEHVAPMKINLRYKVYKALTEVLSYKGGEHNSQSDSPNSGSQSNLSSSSSVDSRHSNSTNLTSLDSRQQSVDSRHSFGPESFNGEGNSTSFSSTSSNNSNHSNGSPSISQTHTPSPPPQQQTSPTQTIFESVHIAPVYLVVNADLPLVNIGLLQHTTFELFNVHYNHVIGAQKLGELITFDLVSVLNRKNLLNLFTSLLFVRSIKVITHGTWDLFALPYTHLTNSGNLFYGIEMGVASFLMSLTSETVGLTGSVVNQVGRSVDFVNRAMADETKGTATGLDFDHFEPRNTAEGLDQAQLMIWKGVKGAYQPILAIPTRYRQTGSFGVALSCAKALPVAIISPTSGLFKGLSKLLTGISGDMAPRDKTLEQLERR